MRRVGMVLGTLGLTSVLCACSVSFNYGARPLGPPPSTPQESCYYEQRLERGTGSAFASWFEPAGQVGNVHLVAEVQREARGMTFYQGGQRLEVPSVMRGLRDPELAQAYAARLAELESAASAARWILGIGIGSEVAGLGLVLGSLPLIMGVHSDAEWARTGKKTASIALVSVGSVLAIVGAIMAGIGTKRYRHATFEEQVYRNLMVDPNLADRLNVRVRQNNQRVAQRCGLEASPEERPRRAPAPEVAPPPAPAPAPPPALPDPYAE
jgi:hypothetical protein